jgi:hypothetical protein
LCVGTRLYIRSCLLRELTASHSLLSRLVVILVHTTGSTWYKVLYQHSWRTLKRRISIGVFVVYIDTGSPVPNIPAKSCGVADENKKFCFCFWPNGNDSQQPYWKLIVHLKLWKENDLSWYISAIRQTVGTEHQYLLCRFLGVSILQLLIIYHIYDYDMLTLSQ